MGFSVLFECTKDVYVAGGEVLYYSGAVLPQGHPDLEEYRDNFVPKLTQTLDPEAKEALVNVSGHGHEKNPVVNVSDAHPGVVEKPTRANSPVLSGGEPEKAKSEPESARPQAPAAPVSGPHSEQAPPDDKPKAGKSR